MTTSSPMTPAVVLCCAVADEGNLASLVQHLESNGLHPEVLAGIDEQPRSLGAALDTIPEAGVVAVYMGAHLSAEHLRPIEGIFGARRGPFHEMYILREPPDVEELLARIGLPGMLTRGTAAQTTRRRSALTPRSRARASEGSNRVDVVGARGVHAGAARDDIDELLRESTAEKAAREKDIVAEDREWSLGKLRRRDAVEILEGVEPIDLSQDFETSEASETSETSEPSKGAPEVTEGEAPEASITRPRRPLVMGLAIVGFMGAMVWVFGSLAEGGPAVGGGRDVVPGPATGGSPATASGAGGGIVAAPVDTGTTGTVELETGTPLGTGGAGSTGHLPPTLETSGGGTSSTGTETGGAETGGTENGGAEVGTRGGTSTGTGSAGATTTADGVEAAEDATSSDTGAEVGVGTEGTAITDTSGAAEPVEPREDRLPPRGLTRAERRLSRQLTDDLLGVGPIVGSKTLHPAASYQDAHAICRENRFQGYDAFRVPTYDELRLLSEAGQLALGKAHWTVSVAHDAPPGNVRTILNGIEGRADTEFDVAAVICVRSKHTVPRDR